MAVALQVLGLILLATGLFVTFGLGLGLVGTGVLVTIFGVAAERSDR